MINVCPFIIDLKEGKIMTRKKGQQLTLEDRVKLQTYLEDGIIIKAICLRLKVSKQTIYREIQRNSIYKYTGNFNSGVDCVNYIKCQYKKELSDFHKKHCYKYCTHYVKDTCKFVARFPFVCNKCEKNTRCRFEKRFYYATKADNKASEIRSITRQGIRIDEDDFKQIDAIISPLIAEKHQSLNHILSTHDEIDVSERTLRNWINNGYTQAKTIDMPRVVRFKVNKEYTHRISKPAAMLVGRMFKNYKEYIKERPYLITSQFDTVYGLMEDHKRLLTIHFPSIEFQFGILLKAGTADEVNSAISKLREQIGIEMFKRIFPVILTDNGVEFNKLIDIEMYNDEKICSIFFCDPYRSGQKGSCERNHELYRYIQPKKKSIENLTQQQVNNIFSNINCVYRKSLSGVRPYDLAKAVLGEKFLEIIGIKEVLPDDVDLTSNAKIQK